MKLNALLLITAQVACVLSVPAVAEQDDGETSMQLETPDALDKREKCWFESNPGAYQGCSDSG